MKFKLLSDLHLEFYRGKDYVWEPEELPGDEDTVLLLAGDIDTGMRAYDWIKDRCAQYKHVVYILGNHEFYGNEWFTVHKFWKRINDNELMAPNFTFLENDVLFLEDVMILGATLWTAVEDQTKDVGFTVWQGKRCMNDYLVSNIEMVPGVDTRKLHPYDTMGQHAQTIKFLTEELAKPWDGKTLVMTHHLPHNDCVAERFKGTELNAFFITDLDELIKEHNIDIWVHGHTHDPVDINVHGTRILCNPKGYPRENVDWNEDCLFDL